MEARTIYYLPVLCLALDTTTPGGSCAVVRDGVILREAAGDRRGPAVAEAPARSRRSASRGGGPAFAEAPARSRRSASRGGGHDTRLPRDLMTLLGDAGVDLHAVDVYAVATGPGSFTGIRIGIATMQGLAFATGKPLIGVSAFDALARAAGDAPRVATWVDAWRGEVFAARYEHRLEVEAPRVEPPAALLRRVAPPMLFIGDGAALYADVIVRTLGDRARVVPPPLLAGTIAQMAIESAAAGILPGPDEIRPLYVRRPDAELARDARPLR